MRRDQRRRKRDDAKGFVELLAAIAPLRTNCLAREALGMDSNQRWVELAFGCLRSWRGWWRVGRGGRRGCPSSRGDRTRAREGCRCRCRWRRRSRLLEPFDQPLLAYTRFATLLAESPDVSTPNEPLHLRLALPPNGIERTRADMPRFLLGRIDLSRVENDGEMLFVVLSGFVQVKEHGSVRRRNTGPGVTAKRERARGNVLAGGR